MKKIKILSLLLAVLVFAVVLAGCQSNKTKGTSSANSGSIDQKGSDTLVNVAQGWAQQFMGDNPDANIAVSGGGSGVGIQALIDGTTDIADASREMKPEEISTAKGKGFTPKETIVGYDGIVVAVNPKNSINQLTIDEIADLFTGKITNWKEVGGSDAPVVLLSRESSSGTYEFFKEHVLNKGDSKGGANFAPSASLLNNTSQIVDQIANNKNAIGYIGMGYATSGIKEVGVGKDKSGPFVKPSEATVKSKEYPVSRSLQVYTKGEPTGLVKSYIDFTLSSKGQDILKQAGFVPLGN